MRKRFGKIIIGGIFLAFFSCVSVFAISEKAVNYHFFSKKTAVRVKEYTKKNGSYIPFENTETVAMPGEFISRVPVVYNEGIDCYIRVKVTITSEREPSVPITMENIVGMSEKWIPIGDYFYYEDVLLEDETVEVFQGICTPTDWEGSIDSGNQWEVLVKVDAIQADYMVPDFQSEDPWGEQMEEFEILDAKEDEQLEDEELKGEFIFTIKSEVEAFQIEKEETFQNMGGFLPGDEKEYEIKVRNLDEKERILYLKAMVPYEVRLLQKMEITLAWEIENCEMILYRGVVSKMQDTLENISFVVSKKAEGILRVCFSLPKEVDNTYTAQEGSFCLVLSDKMIPERGMTDEFVSWTEDCQKENEDMNNDESSGRELASLGNTMVQTGDDSRIWNGIIGFSIGICLFFLSIWKGKRGSHDF